MADKESTGKRGVEAIDSPPVLQVGKPNALDVAELSVEEVLKEQRLWEGWSLYYKSIPLGPGQELQLPAKEESDPEVVGFAFPLPPVEYARRNPRKYPPPSDEEMNVSMFKLIHYTLKMKYFRQRYVLSVIYNHINCNTRDSPGWQRAFIKAGGIAKLWEIWGMASGPGEDDNDHAGELPEKYWVLAIFGRMMGTSAESRTRLIAENVVGIVLEGTKDPDDDVRECAICALKGLITHPEGRKVITYSMLIECLGGRM
uniref:Uncharacterized protein n=1 Tax=Alexandrium andersonii TaxID=327968 RepID=A0A7S2J1I8_9DINO|mmetsp:Transcript_91781/g.205448  ORF Transcript_91781/g.205448 Transcript_91781/m.205448 type:complete len:257 (+) Transcript_91781:62-832(+)